MSPKIKSFEVRVHSNIPRYKGILKEGNLTLKSVSLRFICSGVLVYNSVLSKVYNMDGLSRIRKVISNWYIRYLTATELYMVEPWEKIFIHVLFVIMFALFWHFNSMIIVNGVSQLRFSSSVEEIKS